MEIVKIESSTIVLPDSILDELDLSDGLFLSAELVEGKIVLTPVPSPANGHDWAKFDAIMSRPKLNINQPAMNEEQEADLIVQQIKQLRAEKK
jgi:antitoxin component of MazEF toxin-antitoxin module